MVNGILADVNTRGLVEVLVREMQTPTWVEFWQYLGLALFHFEDVGLEEAATDLEIWQKCQERQLILITDNRNKNPRINNSVNDNWMSSHQPEA